MFGRISDGEVEYLWARCVSSCRLVEFCVGDKDEGNRPLWGQKGLFRLSKQATAAKQKATDVFLTF